MNLSIRRKMGITLVCVVGILLCGGCMLIPPPSPSLAPEIKASRIRSIGVEVTNASESHHLDASDLARFVFNDINVYGRPKKISAHVKGPLATEDAILRVNIVRESLSINPAQANHPDLRQIVVILSSSLSKKDGPVIWQEKEGIYRIGISPIEHDSQHQWSDPQVMESISWDIAHRVLFAEYLNAR